MKTTSKILSIILLLTLILTTAACSANDADFRGEYWNGSGGDQADNMAPSYPDMTPPIETPPEGATDGSLEGEAPETGSSDEDDNSQPTFNENPFISTETENISTFSADVDTASYTYFRKLVNSGWTLRELTGSGHVFRTEEFINYFDYDVNAPKDGELFGVDASIIPCAWNKDNLLLRLTLQADEAAPAEGNNLVFLIDVSGSMITADKLPLLKKTFSHLVDNLTANDRISIVTYSGRESVVLDGCRGNRSDIIMEAIDDLESSGSTNGEAGLTMAYQLAEKNYIAGGNNRIIMASDGDLNVGISTESELETYISQKRDQGVYLSVLGFGTGNYRDNNMEALADNGNGVYYYVDGESEAERIFGTDLLGTLYTVAEDVKLQLTFNKDHISSYRLIGYENRMLATEDFEDDTKDAGEVGASHQVTVCYELTLVEGTELAPEEEQSWMTLATRHKKPGESLSRLNEYELGTGEYAEADGDEKFLGCVIELCMMLHNSKYIGEQSIEGILETLDSLDLSGSPERAEFCELVRTLAK